MPPEDFQGTTAPNHDAHAGDMEPGQREAVVEWSQVAFAHDVVLLTCWQVCGSSPLRAAGGRALEIRQMARTQAVFAAVRL